MTINDWISVTPDNGCGEKTVTITLGKNETGSERTYEVPVYFDDGSIKYITVTQPACGVTPGTDCATSVSASKTIFTFPLSGGTDTFTVTADGDWSFLTSVIASGITASPWHGTSGTTLITLTVEQGSSIDIKENALCAKDGSVIQSGLIEVIRKGDTPTPSPICDDALVYGTYDSSTLDKATGRLNINDKYYTPTVDGSDWAICSWTGSTMTSLKNFMNVDKYTTDTKIYNSVIFSDSFDTSNVTNMGSMFRSCSELSTLDLSGFDTSKVTNMSEMFWRCFKLISLDLSSFNTSNVTDMGSMFYSCSKLTSLNLSSFNTSKVTTMYRMFDGCGQLQYLDVTNFDTSNVTTMGNMFSGCRALTFLDVSGFNTSKVTNMAGIFQLCPKLTSLNLSSFDTSKVTTMANMFYGDSGFENLDVSNFNTSNATKMGGMFNFCSKLTTLDLSNFDTSKVTSMSDMFAYCSGLSSLDISNFNTSNVVYMYRVFKRCYNLVTLDISNFDMSNTEYTTDMFDACTSLTTVKVINCDDATKQKILTQLQTDLSSYTWTLSNGIITRS